MGLPRRDWSGGIGAGNLSATQEALAVQIIKMTWSDEAAKALASTFHSDDAFDAAAHIRDGVISGRLELWRIDQESWAVTQAWEGKLLAWCYVGRNVIGFVETFLRIAKDNGLTDLSFATRRKGLPRMLKRFNPRAIGNGGELFSIEAA
jgi:hypothetical protein